MKIIKKGIGILIFLIFSSLFIYSIYKIITWKINIEENNNIKEVLSNEIKTVEENILTDKRKKYDVNFSSLKEKNKDTVAYLKVNNTRIDYVVVKTSDNSFYLTHNFDKNWNDAGWIFADYQNKFDGTDKNIVIYGHKMKDGSMFGTLKDTLNNSWYTNEDNSKIVLVTEKDTYYYEIFSLYTIVPEMFYLSVNFADANEYTNFLNIIKSRSIYDFNVQVDSNDHILTLSSCLDSYNQKRVVIHARLISE